MLYMMHMIEDAMIRLGVIDKAIKPESTVDNIVKARIFGACFDLILGLEEAYFGFRNSDYINKRDRVKEAIETINNTEDSDEIKHEVRRLISLMPEGYDYSFSNVGDFASSTYRTVTTVDPINELNLARMASLIKCNDRIVNILDPKCNNGDNLAVFKSNIKGAIAYGIESEQHIADQAKQKIDRVAKGSFMGSRISNEVFDVMFLHLPISWAMPDNSFKFTKMEKEFFQDTVRYLRTGGVAIYILPFFRMHQDMCRYFAKLLSDVQVVRLSGQDFGNRSLIAVMGVKKAEKIIDDDTYNYVRRSRNIMDFPDLMSSDIHNYTLPGSALPIDVFRGSILDFDEMATIVQTSGGMDEFWANQKVEKLSENAKQPLLPFNIGQIGLVLTSGCLDGVVDEGNGFSHVIKGRVSKKSDVERSIVDGQMEVHETVSNRVEINVVLPNGEFKVLA